MELELNITKCPFGKSLELTHKPDKTFLDALGEDGMRKMVSDFYDLLIKSPISSMFPPASANGGEILEKAKKHSADFFIQFCGGPSYFKESRGAPRLRGRHSPFDITVKGRDVWLECFREVILKLDIDDELKFVFWKYIDIFSTWMVNKDGDGY